MIHVCGGLILLLVLVTLTVQAETLTGRVVGVHDGDTLTLLIAGQRLVKVRLAGIDAPELAQPYGQKAKQALSDGTFGKEARIESAGPDQYGRTLGTVFVGATNVNAALVEQGVAWVYRKYPHDPRLLVLESQAQTAQRGLWAEAHPIPPWDWRQGERARKAAVRPETATVSSEGAGRCGAKRTCGEMSSCEEARFYLTQCGMKRLDGDKCNDLQSKIGNPAIKGIFQPTLSATDGRANRP